eukprot:1005197-Prymnesium_polylepis.1
MQRNCTLARAWVTAPDYDGRVVPVASGRHASSTVARTDSTDGRSFRSGTATAPGRLTDSSPGTSSTSYVRHAYQGHNSRSPSQSLPPCSHGDAPAKSRARTRLKLAVDPRHRQRRQSQRWSASFSSYEASPDHRSSTTAPSGIAWSPRNVAAG